MRAPKHLVLKVGAPVMLTRNLAIDLVNGTRGRVQKLEQDIVHVALKDGRIVQITRCQFSHYDKSERRDVALRLQFPLRLSYKSPVHRTGLQGPG